MQEIRRFRPSTVSRRFPVAAGFYRTCVLDGVLPHSPAEHVRRPAVPAESPTLGFTHLQFEALLTAARESANPCDFALVAMLGLLGLRIFEATSAGIADLGEEHGHRVLRVCGKGTKVVLVPLPSAAGRAIDRAVGLRDRGPILLNTRSARMDRHAATRRLRHLAQASSIQTARAHPHIDGESCLNRIGVSPPGGPDVGAGPAADGGVPLVWGPGIHRHGGIRRAGSRRGNAGCHPAVREAGRPDRPVPACRRAAAPCRRARLTGTS